jgi:hypothetical protein
VLDKWVFRAFLQFEGLANVTATYRAEGTGQELGLLHLTWQAFLGIWDIGDPGKFDTLNPRTAKDRVRVTVTSPSPSLFEHYDIINFPSLPLFSMAFRILIGFNMILKEESLAT